MWLFYSFFYVPEIQQHLLHQDFLSTPDMAYSIFSSVQIKEKLILLILLMHSTAVKKGATMEFDNSFVRYLSRIQIKDCVGKHKKILS